ncbi:glycosyltransferase family 4 protein [Pseudoduganella umbonata]|uniref:Glycosyltransferase family 4 protein n=2 Tax=Pseudoduganella umbonata TaxID=864828 RepID=A0ABX5UNM0_9BURK|nr:glycosyltransferase family 4 protein [Pseudoduganella umbonata]
MQPKKNPRVVLFQYRMFHYRTELVQLLRDKLAAAGVRLELVYGQAYGKEVLKKDETEIEWGHKVRNRYFPIKEKKDLCWQPLPRAVQHPDMVIFMQENRLLANYWWILQGKLGRTRTAFWGHGRDFQSRAPGGLRERWKQATIRSVDWWFAYTSITLGVLEESGFDSNRVTLLNNSIDTAGFRREAEAVPAARLMELRAGFGIADGAPVGLFCGSIYPDKKPEFMVAAADLIHAQYPDFHFIVIGDGQSAPVMQEAARSRPWMHCVGAKRGAEKAALFRLATFVINPGSVGLHVLDAFALSLPMLTTITALHGPEIAYLEHGKTGFVTEEDVGAYAECALSLIRDPAYAAAVRANCHEASLEYTVDRMATRFADGILRCLREVPKGGHALSPALHQPETR